MRYETKTVRVGENMGPVDWDHPMAKDVPPIWREAERSPADFTFGVYERSILAICMYDGWPYWRPTPAIHFIGPLGPDWTHFNGYGVRPDSIKRRPAQGTSGSAQDAQRLDPQGAGPVRQDAPQSPQGDDQ
ncbi:MULTISPECIES: hypothetical protein [unclassified Sphingopyxis]|uniref:hypothetical protein n=1 Tax=unclassified Sphingopyxis TaxID=2614943 RepID=UPI000730E5BC|nr:MULTISPECIES: hypothetical protein [unclassified Sphingopyxis]KTE23134.1 hypothetical protein ATE61_17760 [Sphingopyxis sp. H057]KTE48473.1 hypothetical protein ATE64_20600 [Sphingopyxis sp. H073]KTE50072.1 hypothetical protein ATE69_18555 [Sphingopyxis sp. H071]KTE58521.1 hypothetical protein ATE66_15185 [Sphingopyxis sp. H107]KTE63220.1 hypothetical protein ATE65_16310 [Sphingopyxis sp. H100]